MRRAAPALLLLAVSAGCGGGSPAAPAAPALVSLDAGRYTLRIFTQPSTHQTQNGVTPSTFVCLIIGSRPSGESVSMPVDVARDGARWSVRTLADGSLRMRLEQLPGAVSGTLEGQASANGVTVTIGDSPQHLSPATVQGVPNTWSIAGEVSGDVTFSGAGGSQSCSSNGWSLVRQ